MKKFLVPFLIFGMGGLYYVLQACPTFYFWDSAELTTAVLTGGVPHPPGFPFVLLLAKLWAWVMPLDKAYSLNLFSALFGALGLALWYLVIQNILQLLNLGKNKSVLSIIAIISVALMGISLTYSIQATRFEVYSLNFAGYAAIVLLTIAIIKRQELSIKLTGIIFILIGLFLGVHNLTIALAIPGIILLLLFSKKMKVSQVILGLLGSSIIAISLYLTIYFLAARHPILNWGDPSNIGRFLDYIFVRGFSVTSSRLNAGHFIELGGFLYGVLSRQLGIAGIMVSLLGMAAMLNKRPRIALPLVMILLLNCLSVAFAENYFYENYDLQGYLVISLSIMILFMAAGFLFIFNYIKKALESRKIKSPARLSHAILAALIILTMAIPAKGNILSGDLSKIRTAQDYAGKFLADAPDGAIIITTSYNTYFCSLAQQLNIHDARNCQILNLYDWDHQWGREEANRILGCDIKIDSDRQAFYRNFLNRFMRNRPIYVEFDVASLPIANYLRPCGLGYLLVIADSVSTIADDNVDITAEISGITSSYDIESVRTKALWLQCRAEYYIKRGDPTSAKLCTDAIEMLASKSSIE